jgi:emfourin
VHVHITRRGGIAGIPLSAEFDTGTLDREQAARIEHAVMQVVRSQGAARRVPPHPDAFEYEIALPEHGETARVGESDLPAELRPLVKKLAAPGRPG